MENNTQPLSLQSVIDDLIEGDFGSVVINNVIEPGDTFKSNKDGELIRITGIRHDVGGYCIASFIRGSGERGCTKLHHFTLSGPRGWTKVMSVRKEDVNGKSSPTASR